jgi:hypothetical protein
MSSDRDALDFPIDEIRIRYQEANDVSPAAAFLHEQELKRYLFLSAKNPEMSLPIARSLDPLWHEFVLDTRRYLKFCQGLGTDIVHHDPRPANESENEVVGRYQKLIELYQDEFNEAPPNEVWPHVSASMHRLGDCVANSPLRLPEDSDDIPR